MCVLKSNVMKLAEFSLSVILSSQTLISLALSARLMIFATSGRKYFAPNDNYKERRCAEKKTPRITHGRR